MIEREIAKQKKQEMEDLRIAKALAADLEKADQSQTKPTKKNPK